MKPEIQTLQALCPAVDPALTREHYARLSDEYWERFDLDAIAVQLAALARLTPEHPAEVVVRRAEDGAIECTVMAFDYPFEFSLITGVLSGMGLSIQSGDIFTYARAASDTQAQTPDQYYERRIALNPLRRRRIIDHFSGQAPIAEPFEQWTARLSARMTEIMQWLEQGTPDAATRAKQRVNEWVTEQLVRQRAASQPVLYPVEIQTDQDLPDCTRIKVVAQDTPAFLYSLTTALSLHGISIERVRIRTIHGRVEDEIEFTDLSGRPVRDAERLNQVKLSVLFTKQFTYFLDKAPDPYKALARFEQMMEDILRLPERGQWLEYLSNPRALQDLARLLGASDYIWEDFIRLQYEALLPILQPHVGGRRLLEPVETLPARLAQILAGAATFAEQRRRLNEFKDRELYLIDLDHILNPRAGFRALTERLTRLAETVTRAAAEIVHAELARRHGRPRTVGGLEARYALLGLGKFGGAALGYASDIEVLFVYSDQGETDGPERITNDEFYGRLAEEFARFIEAKREGIFHVDLRLRPHGNAGPRACSLESFCRYYGPGGPAHSLERLALVRLRAVGGDAGLGRQVERLRDEFIYATTSIQLPELRDFRLRQYADKRRADGYNAKFSPGALVDLENAVQILQVMYAGREPALRTPLTHEALAALERAGVLAPEEFARLSAAYDFLRQLINGLRMLRGSARALFLPPAGSEEFLHLARRMGYEERNEFRPEQQLSLEFELRTAAVRAFVEKHFGRAALPGPAIGNVADLVLSESAPEELRRRVLAAAGFVNPDRAYVNLRAMAGDRARRDLFAGLAVLASDMLRREPDPDMALNNWERFINVLPDPAAHYQALLAQPRRLEILLGIFARSQFLADTLIRNPEFLDWITDPAHLHKTLTRAGLATDLAALGAGAPDHAAWLDALRRWRRREILRIGTRDMGLGVPTREVMQDLAILADAVIDATLNRILAEDSPGSPAAPEPFCVLAFGKLGGNELNYSSDVDLLGVYDPPEDTPTARERYRRIMERLHADISRHTEEGYAYRVDLRLRPYGGAGELVYSIAALKRYYTEAAAPWEIQALLKLRPVAGQLAVGDALLRELRPILTRPRPAAEVARAIQAMRAAALKQQSRKQPGGGAVDVKSGAGGLREIEFLAQGLQLIHAHQYPELINGNTLQALERLAACGVLPERIAAELTADYLFLRRVEHYLQILEDRQIHALPTAPAELEALGKRVLGTDATATMFMEHLDNCLKRVHETYTSQLRALGGEG